MNPVRIFILSALSVLLLNACEEGMGVNITLKSKDKEKDASSAVSLDIDGKDVKVGTSSVESFVSDGKKITVESNDSVKLSPNEADRSNNRTREQTADWTPLFRAWESTGCIDMPSEPDRFFNGLSSGVINLPYPYSEYVTSAIHTERDKEYGEYETYKLGITGEYYGLPVKEVSRTVGIGMGANQYALILDVPVETARQTLQREKVIYRTQVDPLLDPDFGKASIIGNGGKTVIVCDASM
ncbi:hypothetical protein [Neisseria sp. 74A18]|uniref:hypothetical protein n=1 Tax=Neisseria sp. 74A18 TaxID=1696094 RepID=UPI0006CAD0EB|nr:hypothetical protein [Neisseria sp. 74A18]KPN73334.1 hypothetical protein AKG43_08605 [Neisseria sp. 74A18]